MSHYSYQFARKAVLRPALALLLYAVQATSAQSATVTLAWNANPDPNTAGYRLNYGILPLIYTQQIDVGNATMATVSNLSVGTLYYFAAKAYNTFGIESLFSNELAYTVPFPTPTPSPTPSPSPGSTPVNISGTVRYCSDPASAPVPNVTLTITGGASASILSDASGGYQFSSLPRGGTYAVTPTMSRLPLGSSGISTVDVVATQRHFLSIVLIQPGCRRIAADVNGDTAINTSDVIAIQRFVLGLASGTANVGRYQFTPASRTYTGLVSNQTSQDYDALVFGDVASGFVYRQGDPTQLPSLSGTVAEIALPQVVVELSVTNFTVPVTVTSIGADDQLVGFQGDFTFDTRVVTFDDNPVENAGLTSGNWNVSANILPGTGPIRTLRISAFSNDFTPLAGSGTLFNLNMIRINNMPGASTELTWAEAPEQFEFIDADLNTQSPRSAPPGQITLELSP